jgi:hypothetical protein
MVDDALATLDRYEASFLRLPIKGAGEWDWYHERLTTAERTRLRRWMRPTGVGPDFVADMMGRDVDAAMTEWVRLTRVVDAGFSSHVRKSGGGYVPQTPQLGGWDIDRLFPDSGYRLNLLFASQPTCTEYVANLGDEGQWTPSEADWLAHFTAALEDA